MDTIYITRDCLNAGITAALPAERHSFDRDGWIHCTNGWTYMPGDWHRTYAIAAAAHHYLSTQESKS